MCYVCTRVCLCGCVCVGGCETVQRKGVGLCCSTGLVHPLSAFVSDLSACPSVSAFVYVLLLSSVVAYSLRHDCKPQPPSPSSPLPRLHLPPRRCGKCRGGARGKGKRGQQGEVYASNADSPGRTERRMENAKPTVKRALCTCARTLTHRHTRALAHKREWAMAPLPPLPLLFSVSLVSGKGRAPECTALCRTSQTHTHTHVRMHASTPCKQKAT